MGGHHPELGVCGCASSRIRDAFRYSVGRHHPELRTPSGTLGGHHPELGVCGCASSRVRDAFRYIMVGIIQS